MNPKISNFISRYRQSVETILANIEELNQLTKEATILNFAAIVQPEDFEGENDHITLQELVAAVQTMTALEAFLVANNNAHYKALYELKR